MTDKPKLVSRDQLEEVRGWRRDDAIHMFISDLIHTALHYMDEAETQAEALRKIVGILGPEKAECSGNVCDGCRAEMSEALLTAKQALGDK